MVEIVYGGDDVLEMSVMCGVRGVCVWLGAGGEGCVWALPILGEQGSVNVSLCFGLR